MALSKLGKHGWIWCLEIWWSMSRETGWDWELPQIDRWPQEERDIQEKDEFGMYTGQRCGWASHASISAEGEEPGKQQTGLQHPSQLVSVGFWILGELQHHPEWAECWWEQRAISSLFSVPSVSTSYLWSKILGYLIVWNGYSFIIKSFGHIQAPKYSHLHNWHTHYDN